MCETEKINIENLIYNIRGKQVMIDSDLAKLYHCKNGTKSINLVMKRNVEKFPEDFCFQLTEQEYKNLKFQFETSSSNNYGGVRKLPYVFIEEGVAMLSSFLRTDIASKISVNIMRAFIQLRKYISENLIEQKFIKKIVLRHENDIKKFHEIFDNLEESKNQIFFDGQIYDAYSKIVDIFKKTKNELIIIDNYANKTILDIVSNIGIKVILINKTKSLLNKLDIEKYNNLNIIYNDAFHDRYFIIDRKIFYYCGTSINYIGSKTFFINKLEDDIVIKLLMENIKKILNI